MRLFVAINPPSGTVGGLIDLQDQLRARSAGGNFSSTNNLHMTLAFLGECDRAQADSASAALAVLDITPFTMMVDRVGCDRHHGRELWWAGVADCQPLTLLRRQLARELNARGCDFDQRAFRPHITLAREVATNAAPWPVEEFAWAVTRVDLMKSERLDGRLTYTSIAHR